MTVAETFQAHILSVDKLMNFDRDVFDVPTMMSIDTDVLVAVLARPTTQGTVKKRVP